jgi:DNA-binding IclR family transcriptional regulator
MDGTKQIAQRIVTAENSFVEILMGIAGISRSDAFKALATFRKLKVVKLDPVGGRYTIRHGAYMAADVIRRAVNA